MQTTLLSIGFAIILALVAALVGPHFVDWNGYRALLEARATQWAGAPVHISGPISVRLLPTASLHVQGVEVAPSGASPVTVRKLGLELGLGALMRGDVRVDQLSLEGVEAALKLDRNGEVAAPVPVLGFDPDRVGIDHVRMTQGRIVLADTANGSRVALDNVSFTGEVRSLLGPFKGDGAFTTASGPATFRLSGGHRGDDGGIKLHLAVDAAGSALAVDTEGTWWPDRRTPRFDGAVTVVRAAGAALPHDATAIAEPWRVTAKLKATAAGATFDDLAFVYGPDTRPARLSGTATVSFGSRPQAAAHLAARQIDLDRTFTGADRHLPFDVVKAMAESLATGPLLPLPVRISLAIDNLTMAGASISGLRGDAETSADGWTIDSFEWRAPGATQMRIGGRLTASGGQVGFTGPVQIDSSDPAGLYAWIEGRSTAARAAVGPMRGSGVITLGSERIAVENLDAQFDHKSVSGRAAYRFATAAAPARLDASLTAMEIDLDRLFGLAAAASASTTFERPKEIALALDVGRTTYAGVEATKIHALLDFDGTGLKVERLSIADIGGAAVEASGRIDNLQAAGRGSLSVSLIAGRLDGFSALATRLMPQAAEPIRKYEGRLGPLKVTAKLDVEPAKGGVAASVARLKLAGKVAGIDTVIDATGTGTIADPGAATLHVDGRFNADDGRTIAALSGLDQIVALERRPARLTVVADGAIDRTFRIDSRFAATDASASAAGTLKLGGSGRLDVALRAADAKLPRRAPASVPVDLHASLGIDGASFKLDDLSGRVAGSMVRGQVAVGPGPMPHIDGRIDIDQVDGAELVAVLAGAQRPAPGATWPAEPFAAATVPAFNGRIGFRAGSVQWAPGMVAHDMQGAVIASEAGYALDGVTGKLGDGRLELGGQLQRAAGGISLQVRTKLVNADLAAVLAGVVRAPATGRVSIDAEMQGQGLSPASLAGALTGGGVATFENMEIAGLDPAGIDAAITAVDRGTAINNSGRIAEIVSAGLNAGRLRLPFFVAPIAIAEGRMRLMDSDAQAQGADVAAAAAVTLADSQLDMRIVMTGPQRKDAPAGERPSVAVTLKGPLAAARRTVDVTMLTNWLTGRAVEQETKRLDEAERERKRLEVLEARQRQEAVSATLAAPPPPEAALTPTLGHAPDLPPPVDIKPAPAPPPARKPPVAAPVPSRTPFLDFFQQGVR